MTHWDDEDIELLKYWNELQRRRPEPEWTELLASPLECRTAKRSGNPIDDYLQEKLTQSRTLVNELKRDVYVRRKLHEQSVEQIDYQISCAALALDHFKGWAVGYNRGIDNKRIEIERTLSELRREKRSVRLRTWDDLVRLSGELLTRQREYYAVLRRLTLQDSPVS